MAELTEEVLEALERTHGAILADPTLGVVLKPFSESTFDRYIDDRVTAPADATINMTARHVLWPSAGEWKSKRTAKAFLPDAIADALLVDAGAPPDGSAAIVERLDAATPPAVLEAAGLAREAADELIMRHAQGGSVQLALVSHAGATVALRAPTPGEFAALQKAHSGKAGAAAANRAASRDCAIWASEDLSGLFARAPAFPTMVLLPEITRLGGAGASTQFRRRGGAASRAPS